MYNCTGSTATGKSPFSTPRLTTVRIISTNGECIDLTLVERLRWRARARFSVLSSARNSGLRIEMFQIEPAFLDPYLLIGAFEHREIEIVLLADVIIQHALVGAGLGRDPVDARAGQAMRCKFLLRGLKDAKPHALGIALPF